MNGTSAGNNCEKLSDEPIKKEPDSGSQNGAENQMEIKEIPTSTEKKTHQIQVWSEVRPSLRAIEDMMSMRVKRVNKVKSELDSEMVEHSSTLDEAKSTKGAPEEDSEDEFYDLDRSESLDRSDSDSVQDVSLTESVAQAALSQESLPPWKEELECLVQGGVPMALRGEVR